jgi:hypothetical protein
VVGLELGADDYLVKSFSGAELIARMRAVLRRARPAPARLDVVEIGPVRVDLASRRVWRDGAEVQLSRIRARWARAMDAARRSPARCAGASCKRCGPAGRSTPAPSSRRCQSGAGDGDRVPAIPLQCC